MHIVTQVIKEPDERIVLRNESPSSLDSSKFGKPSPSYGNQGDADFHQETSFDTSQNSRSPSPLLDQPLLRERSAASTHLFARRVTCGLTGVKVRSFYQFASLGIFSWGSLTWKIIIPWKIIPEVRIEIFLLPLESISQNVCWKMG